MKKTIQINKRISFKICNTDSQNCVYCGKKIGKGRIAVSMNNKGDDLVIRKNLWIHIQCVNPLRILVEKAFKKDKEKIFAMGI